MKKLISIFALSLLYYAAFAQDDFRYDWPRYSYYAESNKLVKEKPVAVLFGDSITRNWYKNDSQWLSDNGFIGRGISGQTTMHMLPRFRPDVLELNPKYVVILAGINDIACNNGYIKLENIFKNILSMVELAIAHGISPVLCTLTPAGEIGWRREVGDPRPRIDSLNTMILKYAADNNIPVADYHSAMKTADGAMDPTYITDAVHPNLAGYKVMEKVLLEVLK